MPPHTSFCELFRLPPCSSLTRCFQTPGLSDAGHGVLCQNQGPELPIRSSGEVRPPAAPKGVHGAGVTGRPGRRLPGSMQAPKSYFRKSSRICCARRSLGAEREKPQREQCQSRRCKCSPLSKAFTAAPREHSALPAATRSPGRIPLGLSGVFLLQFPSRHIVFLGPTYYIWVSAMPIMCFSVFLCSE